MMVYVLINTDPTARLIQGVFSTVELATEAKDAMFRSPGLLIEPWVVSGDLNEWMQAMRKLHPPTDQS